MMQDGDEYFKNIVCFEIRRGGKKHSKEMPCFHLKEEVQGDEGLFLLHKECFQTVCSGKIDERKWKLE
jgi:hypothetical protein